MSSYTSFYHKVNDKLIPLFTYQNCNYICDCVNDVIRLPYGNTRVLTKSDLQDILYHIEAKIELLNDDIQEYKEQESFIASCNNSIADKAEEYYSTEQLIKEVKEDLIQYIKAKHILLILLDMVSDVEYGIVKGNIDNYIYCGIDVPEEACEANA